MMDDDDGRLNGIKFKSKGRTSIRSEACIPRRNIHLCCHIADSVGSASDVFRSSDGSWSQESRPIGQLHLHIRRVPQHDNMTA